MIYSNYHNRFIECHCSIEHIRGACQRDNIFITHNPFKEFQVRNSGFSPDNFNTFILVQAKRSICFLTCTDRRRTRSTGRTRTSLPYYTRRQMSAVKVFSGTIRCVRSFCGIIQVDVVDIILSTVRSLCRRLNLTVEETTDLLEKVRGGNMGYLWENMEKMDIQLERRNTAEQRERAEKAEKKAEKAEEKLHNMYHMLIHAYHKQGLNQKAIKEQLVSEIQLDEKEVDELLAKYWENGTTG